MTSIIRKILRRAEGVFRKTVSAQDLEREGIFVGETQELDRERLLEELEHEEADSEPYVLLTVYTGETPVEDRGWFEDPVAEFVEAEGFGRWLGGGQGSIGERHFFDVSFAVNDVVAATQKIRAFLDLRFPDVIVEVTSSDVSG